MDYHRLVPLDSFMGRYMTYMLSQETAQSFDFFCGLWSISAACGRFTHVARPRAPVYLNMFIVLVGESGVVRKTTSVRVSASIIRNVIGGNRQIGLIDAKVTPEKLDEILHERTMEHDTAQLAIAVPELAVFLGTERYTAHMPTLLTDLYDSPDEREGGGTIERGAILQRKVWVSFISASTPVWLLKTVNPNVVEGGFTSRCFFIVSNEPKQRIAWPSDPDKMLYQDLCDDIRIIHAEAQRRGPITVHPDAVHTFSHWYNNRDHALDTFKQSFEAREDAHVLRVAALLAINDGSWQVLQHHINKAIPVVALVKHESGAIFEGAETRTKLAMALDIIRSDLLSHGMDPVTRSSLYRKCRHQINNEELSTLLEVMHEIGAIQRFQVQPERGRPAEYIRGTQLILAKGLGSQVLDKFNA